MSCRCLRRSSTWLRHQKETERWYLARDVSKVSVLRQVHRGCSLCQVTPPLGRVLGPTESPAVSGKPHIAVSKVTEHPGNSASGARGPGFLPGSAFPPETFQLRPIAAQSHERDLNFPYFTSTMYRQSIYRWGQWQRESNGLRYSLNKSAKNRGPQIKSVRLQQIPWINWARWQTRKIKYEPSEVARPDGRAGGGASLGSREPLSYSHQPTLYA